MGGLGMTLESPVAKELTSRVLMQANLMAFPPSRAALEEALVYAFGDATPSGWNAMLNTPEAHFLVRLCLPCLILYREAPGRMLRRARNGDDDAFDALLRLDKSVITDPVLWRRWHAALNDPKPGRRKRFRDAMAGRPLKRFNEKTVRIAFAGLLSQIAERENCAMTAPEIRDWFASFTGEGWLSDEVMPGGEALTKAIQRNRDWPAARRKGKETGQ
jgi:hypothetical protein